MKELRSRVRKTTKNQREKIKNISNFALYEDGTCQSEPKEKLSTPVNCKTKPKKTGLVHGFYGINFFCTTYKNYCMSLYSGTTLAWKLLRNISGQVLIKFLSVVTLFMLQKNTCELEYVMLEQVIEKSLSLLVLDCFLTTEFCRLKVEGVAWNRSLKFMEIRYPLVSCRRVFVFIF